MPSKESPGVFMGGSTFHLHKFLPKNSRNANRPFKTRYISLIIACLTLSLLKDSAYETLLQYSSPFIVDREQLTRGARNEALFTWHDDISRIRHVLDSDISPPNSVMFKVYDTETLKACAPLHESNAAIILLYISGGRWAYHDIIIIDS